MKNPKTNYTKKELLNLTWATIGGRIEDFQEMFNNTGASNTFKEIKKMYDEDYTEVFIGLIVYMSFGSDIYYDYLLLKERN